MNISKLYNAYDLVKVTSPYGDFYAVLIALTFNQEHWVAKKQPIDLSVLQTNTSCCMDMIDFKIMFDKQIPKIEKQFIKLL